MSDMEQAKEKKCACCDREFSAYQVVELWDGKVYCHDCVSDKSNRLWSYAKSHDVLEESTPVDLAAWVYSSLRNMVLILIVFVLLFVLLALALLSFDFIVGGFMCAMLFIPVWIAYSARWILVAVTRRSSYAVQRGVFRVYTQGYMREYRLSDVIWMVAKTGQQESIRSLLDDRSDIVLLDFPAWGTFYVQYPCGWSEEMLEVWIGFLKLAVPQNEWSGTGRPLRFYTK